MSVGRLNSAQVRFRPGSAEKRRPWKAAGRVGSWESRLARRFRGERAAFAQMAIPGRRRVGVPSAEKPVNLERRDGLVPPSALAGLRGEVLPPLAYGRATGNNREELRRPCPCLTSI